MPAARKGREMMAPSGKFWMAMPRDIASAPPSETSAAPVSQPARTTPTAMPSGMLCRVTAITIMVLLGSELLGPSASSASRCKWGIKWSRAKRKSVPPQNPSTAGRKARFPSSQDASMAGISKLQIEAATITPAAKPMSPFCTKGLSSSFSTYTPAAPSTVPRKGSSRP